MSSDSTISSENVNIQESQSDESFAPSDFEELLEIPPNMNDDGFEELGFTWKKDKTKNKNKVLSDLIQTLNAKTSEVAPGENTLIYTCCMKIIDLKCLLAYQPKASDANFLWFMNYLVERDLFSKHKPRGCLIPDLVVTPYKDDVKAQEFEEAHNERNYKFAIKLKNDTN